MSLSLYARPDRGRDLDVLKGAAAIAAYLLGSSTRRREIYYLVERRGLPVFRLGEKICARRSTLRAWITAQEQSSAQEAC
jgi:hypothetical protein